MKYHIHWNALKTWISKSNEVGVLLKGKENKYFTPISLPKTVIMKNLVSIFTIYLGMCIAGCTSNNGTDTSTNKKDTTATPIAVNPRNLDCDDTDFQDSLIDIKHHIDSTEMETAIDSFFGVGRTAYYYKMSFGELHTLIDNYDCNEYFILITGDDKKDGKLLIQVVTMPEQMAIATPLYAYYSIIYFKGLLRRYPENSEMHFFKIRRNGVNTVGFKVKHQNATLYTGNLSGLPFWEGKQFLKDPIKYRDDSDTKN